MDPKETIEDDVFDIDVDDLFKDPEEDTPAPDAPTLDKPNELTKAMSDRINEVKRKEREKAKAEAREEMARDFGFASYEEYRKSKEKSLIKDAGLDEEQVEDVVKKLVEQRLADDPRLKELEAIKARDKANFVNTQLKEINKLIGSNFTSIDQLPPETLAMWEKTGDLKAAYLATQGETIITKGLARTRDGSLSHLAQGGNGAGAKVRALNDEEKAIWRSIIPDITEEELAKKTTPISK